MTSPDSQAQPCLLSGGQSTYPAVRNCGATSHRYNEAGADGLLDRRRPGRPARLSEAQLKELDALVEKGPDIAEHGVVRWRCADLQSVIAQTFAVTMSERHVGRMLKKRGFTRLSARPRHPKTDEAAQEAFKKTSP
jgi:transposase